MKRLDILVGQKLVAGGLVNFLSNQFGVFHQFHRIAENGSQFYGEDINSKIKRQGNHHQAQQYKDQGGECFVPFIQQGKIKIGFTQEDIEREGAQESRQKHVKLFQQYQGQQNDQQQQNNLPQAVIEKRWHVVKVRKKQNVSSWGRRSLFRCGEIKMHCQRRVAMSFY